MELERKPGYWAVLPAKVRYDEALRPNAKLLYAEISALADSRGYCWATNEWFAALFQVTGRTISALVKQLADCQYVTVEILRDPATNEITERRIWIAKPTGMDHLGSEENVVTPIEENFHTPHEENFVYNNPKKFNNTPYSPPRGASRRKPKKEATWKPDRFEGFWKFYPRGENKQAAVRAWDRLQPDDDLLLVMGQALQSQKDSKTWQEGIGIPYASTWLNGRRWEDEIRVADADLGGWQESEVL